jgi:hypothetical protein
MASTISAGTTSGTAIAITGDTSGALSLQTNNGTTAVTIDTSANLQFNSGYGSVATAYGCRAWVNFNGQGTVAIRSSGNVSSITDRNTGRYTVNFSTSMPDANYALVAHAAWTDEGGAKSSASTNSAGTYSSSACDIFTGRTDNTSFADLAIINVAVFR